MLLVSVKILNCPQVTAILKLFWKDEGFFFFFNSKNSSSAIPFFHGSVKFLVFPRVKQRLMVRISLVTRSFAT